jgi:hypothetical protein
MEREEVFMVDVAEEGVPEIAVERVIKIWDGTLFEVVVSVLCEFAK